MAEAWRTVLAARLREKERRRVRIEEMKLRKYEVMIVN
jgi:hypothetical protein